MSWRIALFAFMGLVIAGSAPISARYLWHDIAVTPIEPLRPPVAGPPWTMVESSGEWTPRFVAPNAEFLQAYSSGGRRVMLYAARYAANQKDVKLASVSNLLFDREWFVGEIKSAPLTIAGHVLRVRETHARSGLSSLIVWNWYFVDGSFTGNDYVAKLLFAKARLFRSSRRPVAFVVATPEVGDLDSVALLNDFLSHVSLNNVIES